MTATVSRPAADCDPCIFWSKFATRLPLLAKHASRALSAKATASTADPMKDSRLLRGVDGDAATKLLLLNANSCFSPSRLQLYTHSFIYLFMVLFFIAFIFLVYLSQCLKRSLFREDYQEERRSFQGEEGD